MRQTNKQTNKQFFKIHVKPNVKPFEAIKGKIINNPQTEGTVVSYENAVVGTETKVFIDPPICNIPNFYTHLVVKQLDKNGKYQGKIKFVEGYNSAEEGESVESMEIRYIENCPSLDKQWQNENKYKPKNAKAYHGWDFPSNSVQEFDIDSTDKLLIEFFKNHQGNGTHKGRDVQNGIIFLEVNSEKNIESKKNKFEFEKQKLKFIEDIHTNDEIVDIYSAMLGIKSDYDIATKRDEILNVAERITTEGLIKEVDGWKRNYTALFNGLFSDNQITAKAGKIYVGKNPQPFFKDEDLKGTTNTEIVEEIVSLMFKKESMYVEVHRLNESIKK